MVRYCAVVGCYENTFGQNPGRNRRYLHFPKDRPRAEAWMKAIGRMDLEKKPQKTLITSYFVCDLHFAHADYYKTKFKTKLKCNVVPSLMLQQTDEPCSTSKYTQTEERLFEKCRCHCHNTPDELEHCELLESVDKPNVYSQESDESNSLEPKPSASEEQATGFSSDGEPCSKIMRLDEQGEVKLEIKDEFSEDYEFV